jgi:hypothetical protein
MRRLKKLFPILTPISFGIIFLLMFFCPEANFLFEKGLIEDYRLAAFFTFFILSIITFGLLLFLSLFLLSLVGKY